MGHYTVVRDGLYGKPAGAVVVLDDTSAAALVESGALARQAVDAKLTDFIAGLGATPKLDEATAFTEQVEPGAFKEALKRPRPRRKSDPEDTA